MAVTRRGYSNVAVPLVLSGTLDSVSTTNTITVTATPSGWPSTYPYYAVLDLGTSSEEVVLVTAGSGTSFTITRGSSITPSSYGTVTKAHSNGASFQHVSAAADYDEANAHHVATSAVHGVTGSLVGTTDTQTLTNKTLTSPTINTPVVNGSTVSGALVDTTSTQTLSGKTLSSPTITTPTVNGTAVAGTVVDTTAVQTLTNKTLTSPSLSSPTVTGTPTFPAGSIPESAVANLTSDLASKAVDSNTVHLSGTETISGQKNFTATLQQAGADIFTTNSYSGTPVAQANIVGAFAVNSVTLPSFGYNTIQTVSVGNFIASQSVGSDGFDSTLRKDGTDYATSRLLASGGSSFAGITYSFTVAAGATPTYQTVMSRSSGSGSASSTNNQFLNYLNVTVRRSN